MPGPLWGKDLLVGLRFATEGGGQEGLQLPSIVDESTAQRWYSRRKFECNMTSLLFVPFVLCCCMCHAFATCGVDARVSVRSHIQLSRKHRAMH